MITPEYEGTDNDEATYSLWKDTYSLPEKFVSYNKAVRSDTGEPLVEVPLVEYINASMAIGSTSYGKRMFPCIDDGKKFCFYGVDSVTGAPSFRLVAQPQSDFMVNFYYRRFPVDATGPASVIDAPSYLEDAIIRGMVVEFLKRSTTEKGVSPLLQVEASGFKEAVATARRIETSLTQAVVQGSWQL